MKQEITIAEYFRLMGEDAERRRLAREERERRWKETPDWEKRRRQDAACMEVKIFVERRELNQQINDICREVPRGAQAPDMCAVRLAMVVLG